MSSTCRPDTSRSGQQGGPGWHAGQVAWPGNAVAPRSCPRPALHHPGYVKAWDRDGTHFPVDDRGQPGGATVPEHHVGDLVIAVHEARDVVERAVGRSQPAASRSRGVRATLYPLEEGGPPVDLAFVEAIGRPRSCRPFARQSPRQPARCPPHLVGERLPGR